MFKASQCVIRWSSASEQSLGPTSPKTDKHRVKTVQNTASTPLDNVLKESSQIPFRKLSVVPLMLVWSTRTGENSRRCSLLFHADAVSFGLCVSRFYKAAERVNHLSSGLSCLRRCVWTSSDITFKNILSVCKVFYMKLHLNPLKTLSSNQQKKVVTVFWTRDLCQLANAAEQLAVYKSQRGEKKSRLARGSASSTDCTVQTAAC